ncbi:MAG TPA: TonB-dependent receptor [Terriglobales bacterium]
MRCSGVSAKFFLTGIFLASPALAQIAGSLVDPHHSAVPRATVRLLSPEANEISHTLSDPQGKFNFSQACPGCSLEIQLEGFETRNVPLPLENPEIVLVLAPVHEEINVTANLSPTPTEQIGSSVTSLDRKEIADRQRLAFSDLLQTVPGAVISRSGGLGSFSSLFLRGGESDYTKILVDGIPVNDPGGTFDMGSFAADGVQRVEIVRGPQSALFGTDSMTGVIQVFTEHGSSEDSRPHFKLDFDGGKYNTYHGGLGASGQVRTLDYAGYWSRFDTDNQGTNADFRDSTGGLNLGLAISKNTQIRWIGRGDSSHLGTPGQTAFLPPDPGSFFSRADGYSGISINNHTTENWNQRISYSYERSRQVSRADLFPSDFVNDTRRQHLDYQSDYSLGAGDRPWGQHMVTLAFAWDRETGFVGDDFSTFFAPTHAMRDNFGGVFQDQATFGRLYLSNGVRVEDNGSFGKTVIPRSSAAYVVRRGQGRLGATKLKFNFGLGFKEPNFTESFSPEPAFKGNPNLRPERSRSFDFGIEQRLWNDRAKLEINWFDNRFREMVQFQASSLTQGSFFNLNAARAKGAEVIVETAPARGLRLTAGYTYLDSAIEESTTPNDPVFGVGRELLRRPRHSGSLSLSWDWRKLTVSSTTLYVGRRADSDFLGLGLTSSPSYGTWNMALAYRVVKQMSYFAAFDNLLDRSYQDPLGFPALRATYRTGLRLRF